MAARKMTPAKRFEKKDATADKRAGIKEDAKGDMAMDKKGMKRMMKKGGY